MKFMYQAWNIRQWEEATRKKSIKFGIEFICNFTGMKMMVSVGFTTCNLCTEVKWTTAYSLRSNCLQPITGSANYLTWRIHKGEMENMVKKKEAIRVAVMLIDQTMHSPKRMNERMKERKQSEAKKTLAYWPSNFKRNTPESDRKQCERICPFTKEYAVRIMKRQGNGRR